MDLFHPGQRIAIAVSGGADSVALLRRLLEERSKLGIVLSVVHVHHGIRGEQADADAAFVEELAARFELPFYLYGGDAPSAAVENRETLEEAARNLRYARFQQMMAEGRVDAVVTAHTLDDQAETVLYKLLRGAWTEGLSGIHVVLPLEQGIVLRPFLEATHREIESWLGDLNQPWREDATNRDLRHTRNRIRHELLPLLVRFNPEIARQLSRVAAISADEERYWQAELARLLPSLLLPGRPVRGGGRRVSAEQEEASVGIELERLNRLAPAVKRRVLRAAARQLGAKLGFEHTEQLLALADPAQHSTGRRLELPGRLAVERGLREIRLTRGSLPERPAPSTPEYPFRIPGEIRAPAYGILLRAVATDTGEGFSAVLRNWRAGDRVILRHSSGPRKIKEILDRLHVRGRERGLWPVVEVSGNIVWMRGVQVDAPQFDFAADPIPGQAPAL